MLHIEFSCIDTLEDLKTKFKKHEVITTLQCAGNRREDLHQLDVNPIFISPHWVIGAMSTAKWGGVKLRDVLKDCGWDVDELGMLVQHVHVPLKLCFALTRHSLLSLLLHSSWKQDASGWCQTRADGGL